MPDMHILPHPMPSDAASVIGPDYVMIAAEQKAALKEKFGHRGGVPKTPDAARILVLEYWSAVAERGLDAGLNGIGASDDAEDFLDIARGDGLDSSKMSDIDLWREIDKLAIVMNVEQHVPTFWEQVGGAWHEQLAAIRDVVQDADREVTNRILIGAGILGALLWLWPRKR